MLVHACDARPPCPSKRTQLRSRDGLHLSRVRSSDARRHKRRRPLSAADMIDSFSNGVDMPTYHIEMMEGRTVEQKKKLVEEITRVSVEILGGSPESVDILITDVKRENWATG